MSNPPPPLSSSAAAETPEVTAATIPTMSTPPEEEPRLNLEDSQDSQNDLPSQLTSSSPPINVYSFYQYNLIENIMDGLGFQVSEKKYGRKIVEQLLNHWQEDHVEHSIAAVVYGISLAPESSQALGLEHIAQKTTSDADFTYEVAIYKCFWSMLSDESLPRAMANVLLDRQVVGCSIFPKYSKEECLKYLSELADARCYGYKISPYGPYGHADAPGIGEDGCVNVAREIFAFPRDSATNERVQLIPGTRSQGFETRYIIVTTKSEVKVVEDSIRVAKTGVWFGSSNFWTLKDPQKNENVIQYSDVVPSDALETAFYVLTTDTYGAHLVIIVSGGVYKSSDCGKINTALQELYAREDKNEKGISKSNSPATPNQQTWLEVVERFSWAPFNLSDGKGQNDELSKKVQRSLQEKRKIDLKLNAARRTSLVNAVQIGVVNSIMEYRRSTGNRNQEGEGVLLQREEAAPIRRNLLQRFANLFTGQYLTRSRTNELQRQASTVPDNDSTVAIATDASAPAANNANPEHPQNLIQPG